jgi:two-component system, OmpR family, response regulator MprA
MGVSQPLILLIGQEAEAMAPRLEASGYSTALAGSLPEPAAVVLLSGEIGALSIPALRLTMERVPLLLDIVHDSVEGRSECLSAGANDFWLSSAGASDLLMRLRLILQRRSQPLPIKGVLEVADLRLDPSLKRAQRGNRVLTLTGREYRLLVLLVRQAGEVLSRDQILREAWDDQSEAASNVVEVYVRYLRQKLEEGGERRLIHTVRGRGYCLCDRQPPSGKAAP